MKVKEAWDMVAKVLAKGQELHAEYLIMSTKFESLEGSFDKLVEGNERFAERTQKEIDELRRRVAKLEGLVDASFTTATREAVLQLARENVAQGGSLGDVVAIEISTDSPQGETGKTESEL